MPDTPVLIVGAGPTGLTLALRLARHGVPFRLVDRAGGPGQASRAVVVQGRTLEFYGQLGLAEAVVARGIKAGTVHLRVDDREAATFSLLDAGGDTSPYPFALSFPQDDHERFLGEQLAAAGGRVEWNTELTGLEQDAEEVRATLRRGGAEERCAAAYLCGCDGAHTAVRPLLGIGFPGGTYDQLFYVADVAVAGLPTTDLSIHLGARALALMLPVRSSGTQRLIGIVPSELGGRRDLSFEDIRPSAEALLGIRVAAVNWFSTYRVHHRVADRFRVGRAFLLGDAGHLHSPAGGQGMNTGIGDAVNLAWKLAHAVQGRTAATVLDSYEPERLAFARTLVASTDRAFQGMVGEGWRGRLLRRWVVPHLLPALIRVPALRRALFNTVSQIRVHYRRSPLSAGRAGRVWGGDRLPWAGDNYTSLQALDWRIHVYGDAGTALESAAAALGVGIDRFAWTSRARGAGLRRDAAYLVRPDGHVALALAGQDPAVLTAYAARIGLTPRAPR